MKLVLQVYILFLFFCADVSHAANEVAETSPESESIIDTANLIPAGADAIASLLSLLPVTFEGWVTFLVSICALFAAIIPRPKDDANISIKIIYGIINAVGFNIRHAKNASSLTGIFKRK